MGNAYYQHGARRAGRVRDLFGTIARRYDLLNDLQSLGWHRVWKRRLARLARLGPGQEALDVCCGTGDVAGALARTGARVVGVDFSAAMLEVARRRWGNCPGQRERVQFVEGDALHLPFADHRFEAVTISYGLRNLADFGAGLAEMWRVARPGGRLLVLDFGWPSNRGWRALYHAYLRRAVPLFGRVFAGSAEAYAYILESLRHYPGQQWVAAWMRQRGMVNVAVEDLVGGAMAITWGEKGPDDEPASDWPVGAGEATVAPS